LIIAFPDISKILPNFMNYLNYPEHMLQYASKRQQKPEAARSELTKKEDENDY
jgi:hypothetical protein